MIKHLLEDLHAAYKNGTKIKAVVNGVLLEFEPKEMAGVVFHALSEQAEAWVGIAPPPLSADENAHYEWRGEAIWWIPLVSGIVIDETIVPGLPAEFLLSADGKTCLVKVRDHAIDLTLRQGYVFLGYPKRGYILRKDRSVL